MNLIFSIAIGGALGSLMRHYSISALARMLGDAFPYGTLFVNVVGSFIIGALLEVMALKWQVSQEIRAFLFTGVLGGFTTFSAFSLDVFKFAQTGQTVNAAVYVLASVGVSLLAVFGGAYLVRHVIA